MECCICLSDVDDGCEVWACSVCSARCHFACFSRWCSSGTGCPQCRDCGGLDLLLGEAIARLPSSVRGLDVEGMTTGEKVALAQLMWTLVVTLSPPPTETVWDQD
jgi:hypothetical protein